MPLPAMRVGDFPLSGVAGLPNVTIAFPGEHWSNRRASGAIVPGEAVVPVSSGGKLYMRKASSGDAITQLAIAMRVIEHPDSSSDSTYTTSLGPTEIQNAVINNGEYVHAYYSGVFHLTLVLPGVYLPGDLVGWQAGGARPTGKAGTGSWAKNATADIDSFFEVMEFRDLNATHEGILTVRSLRGQF
jgi:hypothetical protein